MKNKAMERMSSYIVLCLIGAVFFYFDGGIALSLQYAGMFLVVVLLIELMRKVFSKKKNESSAYPLPETDERIEKLTLKVIAQIFALSLFVAFIAMFVLYLINSETVIRVEYILGYLFLVLFVGLGFGSKIAKKLDQ